jgi:hypothetical protein
MEARLKEDILREAEHYGGAIMVIHETNDGQIFDAWEHVNSDAIQTPLEVFKSLEADGFPIKYARVPITDGKAPKSSDFDTLAVNIASASKDTAFVFNCQVKVFLLSCFCFTCMWRCSYTSECFCVCVFPLFLFFSLPFHLFTLNDFLILTDG